MEQSNISIPLELLDQLCNAAKLLADGSKIDKPNRPTWAEAADQAREYLNQALQEKREDYLTDLVTSISKGCQQFLGLVASHELLAQAQKIDDRVWTIAHTYTLKEKDGELPDHYLVYVGKSKASNANQTDALMAACELGCIDAVEGLVTLDDNGWANSLYVVVEGQPQGPVDQLSEKDILWLRVCKFEGGPLGKALVAELRAQDKTPF